MRQTYKKEIENLKRKRNDRRFLIFMLQKKEPSIIQIGP